MEIRSNSENMTEAIASTLAKLLTPGMFVALWGDLGAGKTAFVRGMARGLGFDGIVNSPTYTIMHIYESDTPLYHFDLYRLSGEEEVEAIGAPEYFYGKGISAVEWPDNAGYALPDKRVDIDIKHVDESKRMIRFKTTDEIGRAHV